MAQATRPRDVPNAWLHFGVGGSASTAVFDARCATHSSSSAGLGLDSSGFELFHQPSALSNEDFYSDATVSSAYYQELEGAVVALTGADRAKCFMHRLRNSNKAAAAGHTRDDGAAAAAGGAAASTEVLDYVAKVHVDYSMAQAREVAERVLGGEGFVLGDASECDRDDEASCCAPTHQVLILNVWRSIGEEPVRRDPLAVADTRSVSSERDLRPVHLMMKPDSSAQWYYYPDMTRDEILVFKQYDSLGSGLSDACFHSSFELMAGGEQQPTELPIRESIECRLVMSRRIRR